MEAEAIQKAKNFITAHLDTPFTLEDVAQACGYSAYHFSREFHKAEGVGVMDFVRKERIMASRAELTAGGGIYDAALKYGFDTHTGFTNAFYRYTGCNPGDYRRHEKAHLTYKKGEIQMDDKETVIRMIKMSDVSDMWENVFSRNTPEEIRERIQRDLDGYGDRTHIHAVAEVDKTVVGTLGLQRFNKYWCCANLGDCVVHPSYQGLGLTRKMLDKIKEEIRDTNIDTLQIQCRADSADTGSKYVSLGFTEVFRSGGLVYFMMAL